MIPPSLAFMRWFDALMCAFCSVSRSLFGFFTLMVCVDIVFESSAASMPWLVEVIEYLMYGGTFLAAPWVFGRASMCGSIVLSVSAEAGRNPPGANRRFARLSRSLVMV